MGEVRLLGARITGELDCHGGLFYNPKGYALAVERAHMGGGVFLGEGFLATGEVRLVGASITGDLHCRGGIFHNPDGLALMADRVDVRGVARLDQGFRTEGMVRLEGARVAQLDDDEASWPSEKKLFLDGFVYSTIGNGPMNAKARHRWLKRQPQRPFRPQPYQQLAKVFREHGYEAEAKRVLIAKEWARRKHGSLECWTRCWNWLLYLIIGYGYRPYQALGWAVLLVIVGGFLFGMVYDKEIVIPTKAEAYATDKKTRQATVFYPDFRRWLYSLDTLVPIINFGQKDYWGPQVACNRSWLKGGSIIRLCVCETRALYVYRWVHTAFGWMLITLVITGFTNLVRKE